jgi:hypothetical protein
VPQRDDKNDRDKDHQQRDDGAPRAEAREARRVPDGITNALVTVLAGVLQQLVTPFRTFPALLTRGAASFLGA